MATLARIQTVKVSLDDLIKNSLTIQSLPEAERRKFIDHVKALPKDKKKEIAQTLLEERSRIEEVDTVTQDERKRILEQVEKDFKGEVKRSMRKITAENEKMERKHEEKQIETLLDEKP